MTVTAAKPTVPRDRFGRPMIVPPTGGAPVAYTRATTWADTLDDRYNLERWKLRQAAIGLADRPDLLLAATTQRDDKKALDATVDAAMEAARSKSAATTGTALHRLTEYVDLGLELPTIPATVAADLDAYRAAVNAVELEMLAVEEFVVVDDLQVAGTFDRLVDWQGRTYVADLKTGHGIDYALGSIAIQLALYSRGVAYDPISQRRTPLPNVDQSNALVIHLPAGTGECRLVWVNIALGWEAALLAGRVRKYRAYARNGLHQPFA